MADRLARVLGRFVSGAPRVRAATQDDLAEVLDLALRLCAEQGRRIAATGPEKLARLALDTIGAEVPGVILLAVRGVRVVGMVWCVMYEPDAWDDRPVMLVDWLYVRREERRRVATVLELLRAADRAAQRWGAGLVRFNADGADERLLRQYEKMIGARRGSSFVNFVLARDSDPAGARDSDPAGPRDSHPAGRR
jgi:hypothetical protein